MFQKDEGPGKVFGLELLGVDDDWLWLLEEGKIYMMSMI